MKKFKKVLTMVLAFALVICLTVAATVAYLSDKTAVAKNTFTMGKVDIILDEAVVNEKGEATTTRTEKGNFEVVKGNDGNDYGYALVPGRQVAKDPTVHVIKNSEDCYVRMNVTLDNAKAFAKVYMAHKTEATNEVEAAIIAMKSYFVGYNEETWKFANAKLDGDKLTVTFNYKEVVKKSATQTDLEPIITAVKLPEWVTSEDAESIPNFSVTITADAIQAEGFADAKAAWDAFDGQTNAITGEGIKEPTNP